MRYSLLLFLIFCCFQIFSQTFNIVSFGAIGDSTTINTAAIQKAIDSCSGSGGGRVLVPQGIFLTGTIKMKSNVELHIDSGGVLKGSSNLNDYPQITPQLRTFTDEYVQRSLIFAEGVRNISFTGEGIVNGNGLASTFINSANRVFGFRIYSSSNVLYADLTLKNSAFWMMHNCNLDTLTIRNLTITNHCFGNQDGVNIDMCRNVLVENCDIDGNNDPIVMKGTAPLPTSNVEVRNCTLATYSRAIKIGTETQGFFNNIYVHDCVVKKSTRGPLDLDAKCGINLSIVDGGGIDGVRIENIQLQAITPIMIRLGNQARKYTSSAPTPGVGYVKHIELKNVTAVAKSNITSHITGIPNYKIEDIRLENVQITLPGGMNALPNYVVPENENQKPEHDIFGDTIPAYGLFIRHAKNIQLCNVSATPLQADGRPYMIVEDVENFDSTCVNAISEVANDVLLLYPNPANDFIYLKEIFLGNSFDDKFEVFDAIGKKLLSTDQNYISVLGWKNGVYFVRKGKVVKTFFKQ
jgi:hypothetical protein